MATVIDALIVTLGLDPTEFTKGQKAAGAAFVKTREEAVKSSKQIEDAGKKAADGIKKIAVEALALFALFTGARSVKSFVDDLTSADAALGRFGHNLSEAPQTISAWQKAAERAGGSAQTAAATISKLSESLLDLRVNGKALPDAFYQLQAAAGMNIQTDRGPAAYMDSIAAALQRLNAIDPAKAAFLAHGMGVDDATLSIMERYGAATNKYIESLKGLGPTAEEAKQAQEFQERWIASTQTLQNVFERAFRTIEPGLMRILEKMDAWVNANKDMINDQVVEYMGKLGQALQDLAVWIAKPETLQGFREFASEIKDIAKFVMDLADGVKSVVGAAAALSPGKQSSNKSRDDVGFDESYKVNSAVDVRKGSIADSLMQWWNGGSDNKIDGARAKGGPVSGGKTYLVGENGPELFVAGSSGTIVPNGGGGGSSLSGTGDTSVDGRPVSKVNPMPVFLANSQAGGENWLQTLGKWFTGDGGSSGGGLFGGLANALSSGASNASPRVAKGTLAKNQKEAYAAARAEGLSDLAARSLVANMSGEALHDPGNVHSDPSWKNPNQKAHGIVQWDDFRAARIKGQFGQMPHHMSVADQTKAAIWEMKNFYKATWNSLQNGKSGGEMVASLVTDYERPANSSQAIRQRMGYFNGLGLNGSTAGARVAANNTTNDNRPSTTNSSTSETKIGKVVIHTQAKDAHGIAKEMNDALKRRGLASSANYGPR